MKRIKNKIINRRLNSYPCSDYLHNALYFIANGKPEVAYDEICWVIIKSGGSLSDEEQQLRSDV